MGRPAATAAAALAVNYILLTLLDANKNHKLANPRTEINNEAAEQLSPQASDYHLCNSLKQDLRYVRRRSQLLP
jgi:hypothetical protein